MATSTTSLMDSETPAFPTYDFISFDVVIDLFDSRYTLSTLVFTGTLETVSAIHSISRGFGSGSSRASSLCLPWNISCHVSAPSTILDEPFLFDDL